MTKLSILVFLLLAVVLFYILYTFLVKPKPKSVIMECKILGIEDKVYDSKVKDSKPIHKTYLQIEFTDTFGKIISKKVSCLTQFVVGMKVGDRVQINFTSKSLEFIKSINRI